MKESDRKARTEICSKKLLVEKESIQDISEHPASQPDEQKCKKLQLFFWLPLTLIPLAYCLLLKVQLYQAPSQSFEHILSFHCVSGRLK